MSFKDVPFAELFQKMAPENVRERVAQSVLGAQDAYRRTREEFESLLGQARRQADEKASANGVELDSPDIVNLGGSQGFSLASSKKVLRKSAQAVGAVFVLGLVVSATGAFFVGFLQVLLAFFLVTRVLGIRVDMNSVTS
ncbi:MAG: hypothetical protein GY822_26140 [Deltaproteobacteria bacterium]|nr:hypothetical protein [Deltaproteobacteria bacterium]